MSIHESEEVQLPLLTPPDTPQKQVLQTRPRKQEELTLSDKMRKYYKLLLVIVTVVSLVCFIFYKTQYDKLYNVLEVLEFFGNNDGIIPGPRGVVTSSPSWIPPAFQRINDDAFVYSAFCQYRTPAPDAVDLDMCGQILALAVVAVKADGSNPVEHLRCKLLYEGFIKPIEGVFSSSVIDYDPSNEKKDFLFQQLTCESKFSVKSPYGVIFISDKDESRIHVEERSNVNLPDENLGACLLPIPSNEDSTFKMLESVLLNSYFGLTHFYIYDAGVTNKFIHELDRYRHRKDGDLTVRVIPWNPPKTLSSSLTVFLIKMDCFLRSPWKTLAVLTPSQILVPKSASSIPSVLKNVHIGGHVNIPVLRFCPELPSEQSAAKNEYSLMALEQGTYDKKVSEGQTVMLMNKMSAASTEEAESSMSVDENNLAVHDYSVCDKLDFEDEDVLIDRRVVDMSAAILKKIGSFFPLKGV